MVEVRQILQDCAKGIQRKIPDDYSLIVRIKAGKAYYISSGSDHVAWTESDHSPELLFLAPGEGLESPS